MDSARRGEGGEAVARLVEELVARLEGGLSPGEADCLLDDGLSDLVKGEVRSRIEREIEAELEPFRGRMAPEVYERTRHRSFVDRLRRDWSLPRLALAEVKSGDA